MMRWLQSLSPAFRLALYAVTVAAVFALAIGIGAMATIIYQGGTGSGGEQSPQQGSTQEDAQISATSEPTQMSEAEYLTTVGDIQNGVVETIASSNDKLRRYDTLTPDDTADLQTNYSTLGDYRDQIENLDPPEGYRDQYETFRGAIRDLYDATEIAYWLASDPVLGTREDFEEYERRVDEATTALQQSNEMLGQNFDTTEGLQLPTRTF